LESKGVHYQSLETPKHIYVGRDSSVKLHDMSTAVVIRSGDAGNKAQMVAVQRHKVERLVHHAAKAAIGGGLEGTMLASLAEDVKNCEFDYKAILIKHCTILKDCLTDARTLFPLIQSFLSQGRPSAIWKLLEYSPYRNHILAAKHRAEDSFEEGEGAHPQYKDVFK
jgi:hypothetical protein